MSIVLNANMNEQIPYVPPQESSPLQQNETYTNGESRESYQKSIQNARAVKKIIRKVLTTREELAKHLAQYGLTLLTSAVEFTHSKDFIRSSYILYTQNNNYLEPLENFISRYPDYRPSAEHIAAQINSQNS